MFYRQFRVFSRLIVRSFCTHFNTYACRTHTCGELNASHCGKVVTICGWISFQRCNRFIILRDSYGSTQVIFNEKDQTTQKFFENLPLESVVQVEGTVSKRPSKDINKRMPTGEIEVEATNVKLLNVCSSNTGISEKNFDKVSDALKQKYRYLSLRSAKLQENLRLRSAMLMKMREYLIHQHGFVDVETPTLFKRTPGGAKEFVVPTKFPGHFYCLTQSPQQFKQLLMVGGLDRYFQVARCYRNEGTKADRQPEFTQLDIELSFTNAEHVQSLVESLLFHSWPSHKPKIQTPFPTIAYKDAIQMYGTDKPDLRYDLRIQDLSEDLKQFCIRWSEKVGKYPESVNAIVIPCGKRLLKKSFLQDLCAEAEIKGVKCFCIGINDNLLWSSSISKFIDEEDQKLLSLRRNMKKDDLLFLALGKNLPTLSFLGKSRCKIAEYLRTVGTDLIRTDEFAFAWIIDFPLFLENDEGHLESAHHPFTAPVASDCDKIYSEPAKVLGQHYDLVLNGHEIGGGSIRIHDSNLQRFVIEEVLKENVHDLEHLIKALESGCPPHGGIALGIDRLLAILCDCPSIAHVIAFPKSLDGKDLLSGAPSPISLEDQKIYHIKPILEE